MGKFNVNGEISFEAAEGFQVMTNEELTKVTGTEGGDRWGLWDKERHVMVVIDWKKYNRLLLGLTDITKIAERNEELNSKLYANNNYQMESNLKGTIGGLEAEGYRFSFQVGEVVQSADCLLVRHEKNIYRFTCNGRSANRSENEALFKQILDTVEFA